MSQDGRDDFWSLVCDLQPIVVMGFSLSFLFVLVSLVLLVTDATDQGPILVVNVAMLTPVVLVSGIALRKCRRR